MISAQDAPELTAPFWEACRRDELVRPVCDRCSRSFFSPQVLCPWCQSPTWTYQPSVGRGEIYSFTVIHRPPEPVFEVPYVVADVELDESWRMFTWIVSCKPEAVRIGMRVGVKFIDGPRGERLPAFEPEPLEE